MQQPAAGSTALPSCGLPNIGLGTATKTSAPIKNHIILTTFWCAVCGFGLAFRRGRDEGDEGDEGRRVGGCRFPLAFQVYRHRLTFTVAHSLLKGLFELPLPSASANRCSTFALLSLIVTYCRAEQVTPKKRPPKKGRPDERREKDRRCFPLFFFRGKAGELQGGDWETL